MSPAPYPVELTQTAQAVLDGLGPEETAEVTGRLVALTLQPFPGSGSRVVRLRTSPPSPTPRFYLPTHMHGILFSVEGDLVTILVIDERPVLE